MPGAEMGEPDDQERTILRAWGDVIRRYRHWKRFSRRELAERAGISTVYLGEIERGEKDPSSHSLCLVAAALDVSLAELYLRVATRLDTRSSDEEAQHALPLGVREASDATQYAELAGVPQAKDETAFDLYALTRQLRTDQQLSLLVLARSLMPDSR
jgi:transcriptional regulator with XRE-family HTH domain